VQRPLARRGVVVPTEAIVTRVLVVFCVAIYLITVAQGTGLNDPGGELFSDWALFGPLVDHGDWWRLITSAFLHGSLIHIIFNMLALWWLGAPVEMVLGRVRFIGLYLVSGLSGAAGALIDNPTAVTVGASGAIFGLLGAGLILEWQATGSLGGNYLTLIVINLAISFAVPGISIGGHIGGLVGGTLATLAFSRFGRGHAAYGRLGVIGAVSLVVIAVGSVLISYWKVRGLA
jgi:membrane associated rhomboid family serine protease